MKYNCYSRICFYHLCQENLKALGSLCNLGCRSWITRNSTHFCVQLFHHARVVVRKSSYNTSILVEQITEFYIVQWQTMSTHTRHPELTANKIAQIWNNLKLNNAKSIDCVRASALEWYRKNQKIWLIIDVILHILFYFT